MKMISKRKTSMAVKRRQHVVTWILAIVVGSGLALHLSGPSSAREKVFTSQNNDSPRRLLLYYGNRRVDLRETQPQPPAPAASQSESGIKRLELPPLPAPMATSTSERSAWQQDTLESQRNGPATDRRVDYSNVNVLRESSEASTDAAKQRPTPDRPGSPAGNSGPFGPPLPPQADVQLDQQTQPGEPPTADPAPVIQRLPLANPTLANPTLAEAREVQDNSPVPTAVDAPVDVKATDRFANPFANRSIPAGRATEAADPSLSFWNEHGLMLLVAALLGAVVILFLVMIQLLISNRRAATAWPPTVRLEMSSGEVVSSLVPQPAAARQGAPAEEPGRGGVAVDLSEQPVPFNLLDNTYAQQREQEEAQRTEQQEAILTEIFNDNLKMRQQMQDKVA